MNKLLFIIFSVFTWMVADEKSPIREYINKNGIEKIKKSVVVTAAPQTARGYEGGHGRTPRLTSVSQIPDTLALITFYVYDVGSQVDAGNIIYSYNLSEHGGNYIANGVHKKNIEQIRETYRKMGIVVLTPDQFLDTEEKKNFYYTNFKPGISKLGSFLSGLENKKTDVAVAADYYRGFDLNAAADHVRMEALGDTLVEVLGVDGVLSVALELSSNGKETCMNGAKMAIHAPNPIAKQDRKYVSQNMGAGYYSGQIFAGSYFYFKKPMRIAEFKKKKIENENYDGIGDVLGAMAEEMQDAMKKAIEKTPK